MIRVFISYRRDDSGPTAALLQQRFRTLLGPRSTFRDTGSIPLGADFAMVLSDTIRRCDVMLVLIGSRWLDATDERGHRRLEDPHDFVLREIAEGLRAEILVIPVLLDDTPMPAVSQVPEDIAPLVTRQAVALHADQRQGEEIAIISRQMQMFVRLFPRHPLLRRLTVLLPLLTIGSYLYTLGDGRPRTDFTLLVQWVMVGMFWLVPIIIAARGRLWQYTARLLFPLLLYLIWGQDVLHDPSAVNWGKFAVAVMLETVFLSNFAQVVPRALAASANSQSPSTPAPWLRWLRTAVAIAAALNIIGTAAGSLLLVGRDVTTEGSMIEWGLNAHLAATYVGVFAVILAFGLLINDAIDARMRVRTSSPWGDRGTERREGGRVSIILLRASLLILPIVLGFGLQPALDALTTTQANYYAVNFALGGIGFGIGALLSLVRIPRPGPTT